MRVCVRERGVQGGGVVCAVYMFVCLCVCAVYIGGHNCDLRCIQRIHTNTQTCIQRIRPHPPGHLSLSHTHAFKHGRSRSMLGGTYECPAGANDRTFLAGSYSGWPILDVAFFQVHPRPRKEEEEVVEAAAEGDALTE